MNFNPLLGRTLGWDAGNVKNFGVRVLVGAFFTQRKAVTSHRTPNLQALSPGRRLGEELRPPKETRYGLLAGVLLQSTALHPHPRPFSQREKG